MSEMEERLSRCFLNVFPGLASGDVAQATMENVAAWDSVAHVTLLVAVGEEFALDIPPEDFEELTSYGVILQYLKNEVARS